MTPDEKIEEVLKLIKSFEREAQNTIEEPEQDQWWDLINSIEETLEN